MSARERAASLEQQPLLGLGLTVAFLVKTISTRSLGNQFQCNGGLGNDLCGDVSKLGNDELEVIKSLLHLFLNLETIKTNISTYIWPLLLQTT